LDDRWLRRKGLRSKGRTASKKGGGTNAGSLNIEGRQRFRGIPGGGAKRESNRNYSGRETNGRTRGTKIVRTNRGKEASRWRKTRVSSAYEEKQKGRDGFSQRLRKNSIMNRGPGFTGGTALGRER